MAIAPFEETSETTRQAAARPLRVIPGGRSAGAAPRRSALHASPLPIEVPRRARDAHPSAQRPAARPDVGRQLRPVNPAAARNARPGALARPVAVSVRVRRGRAAVAVSVLAAVVLLALPIHALGAVTVAGQATPDAAPAGLAPGSTIVVQPGDSIDSVAMRINPSDAVQLERSLANEVGSNTLVPGEHIVIP